MKRMKKIVSILLAAIMVLGMSMTAFATEGDSVDNSETTVTLTAQHVYEVYQIFIGDYAEVDGKAVLSNVKWGGNSKHRTGEEVDAEVLKELEDVVDGTDTEKLAVIEKYVNLNSQPMLEKSVHPGSGTIIIDGKDEDGETIVDIVPGYYLVKDQNNSLTGTTDSYTLYLVEVVGDGQLIIKPKGNVPTPDKKIVEDEDNKVETNEASIGDEVNYEITGTMPSNIDAYTTYYYMFTDTLSKGLTYKENSIKVTVDGVDVTKYFYKGVSTYDEEAGTTIEVGIQDIKALALKPLTCTDEDHEHGDDCYGDDPVVPSITAETKVVLTYTATLNENAVIAGDGNPNDVKLSYSNDPNHKGNGEPPEENPKKPEPIHPIGESPKKEVVTYTTELTITKTNQDGAFLPGVEFTLTGNGVNVVLVTEETFVEAEDGEYWKLATNPETYTKTAPVREDIVEDGEVKVKNNVDDYADVNQKYKKVTNVVAKGNGKTETSVVGTVQADGTVTFKGLGAGDYTLEETKTLPGYNTIDPIEFTITFNETTKEFTSSDDRIVLGKTVVAGEDGVEAEKSTNTFVAGIVNQKGSLLPSTGGIGTTIFYVVGGILVIGAGILLVAKKRMSKR